MPEMTTYGHGLPCWADLATPDPARAKDFYSALFGWQYTEPPTGDPDVGYVMAMLGDRPVAGMLPLTDEMAASGVPPRWTCYVAVDDVDATTAEVEGAGGSVLRPPMDVVEAGRMALVADPTGAALGLWQGKQHKGALVVNEPSAMCWIELTSPDPAKAAAFYEQLLGWTHQDLGEEMGHYVVFSAPGGGEDGIAGAMAPPSPAIPPSWGVYFAVEDCDATGALAQVEGASMLLEPTDIPTVGRFAVLMDPTGAPFSILQPSA